MTARVQGRKPRVYTRDRAEKYRRAGTVKDSARIYPRPCGKVPPRGYRERFRAVENNRSVKYNKNTFGCLNQKQGGRLVE